MGPPAPVVARPTADIDAVLSGRFGPEALRHVASEPWRHGLGEVLDQLPPGESIELLRTKYKPDRKLSAYYRLSTRIDGSADRHLAVTWSAERVSALVSPADPAMPQLTRLSRAEHLAGVVGRLTGHPAALHAWPAIRIVRYRPAQRHVLHVPAGPGRPGIFVKTDRDDCGARVVPVAEALGASLAGRCPGARLATPVGYSFRDRAAIWQQAPGEPLWRHLQQSNSASLVELLGRGLRVLHDSAPAGPPSGPGGPAGLPAHDVEAEAASALRAGEHIAALLPSTGRTYRALVAEVLARLARLPEEADGFTHGDLKSDNILVHRERLTILDLDRAAWAEPALDLGKLVADLRWWCPNEERVGLLVAALRAGYGTTSATRWARAGLLATLFQLKLAARRCAVHEPGWASRVSAQVAGAAAALSAERSG